MIYIYIYIYAYAEVYLRRTSVIQGDGTEAEARHTASASLLSLAALCDSLRHLVNGKSLGECWNAMECGFQESHQGMTTENRTKRGWKISRGKFFDH